MPRRNAESGSHEVVGSRAWIVRGIVIVAALAVGWATTAQLNRVKSLEDDVKAMKAELREHDKRIDKNAADLERVGDRVNQHGHAQDPKIGELDRRIDRLERPRPWERPSNGR